MGHRRGHRHWLTAIEDRRPVYRDEAAEPHYIGACGETMPTRRGWSRERFVNEEPGLCERDPTCPTCSGKWGKAKIAKLAEQGTHVTARRLTKEDDDRVSAWKSVWRVEVNGESVGDLYIDNGYGKSWRFNRVLPRKTGGFALAGDPSRESPLRFPTYHSKEAGWAAAPDLLAKGHLLTATQARAEYEAEMEGYRQESARLRAARRDREERERTALEGLRDLRDRDDLTNLQRAGVEAALALIGKKQEA